MIIVILTSSEKELVTMMGMSSRRIPYATQVATPSISTSSMVRDTSSAFFSLIVFTTCGTIELEVSIPATRPMIGVQFMGEVVQITRHFA